MLMVLSKMTKDTENLHSPGNVEAALACGAHLETAEAVSNKAMENVLLTW